MCVRLAESGSLSNHILLGRKHGCSKKIHLSFWHISVAQQLLLFIIQFFVTLACTFLYSADFCVLWRWLYLRKERNCQVFDKGGENWPVCTLLESGNQNVLLKGKWTKQRKSYFWVISEVQNWELKHCYVVNNGGRETVICIFLYLFPHCQNIAFTRNSGFKKKILLWCSCIIMYRPKFNL